MTGAYRADLVCEVNHIVRSWGAIAVLAC